MSITIRCIRLKQPKWTSGWPLKRPKLRRRKQLNPQRPPRVPARHRSRRRRPADHLVFFLAPVVLVIPALLAYSVIPYGRNMVPLEMDAALLFFFAVGAGTELAVFMAGWASRNKYSLLGAMRAIAQMLSYEIPLVLSAVPVVMLTGTLSLATIVNQQATFSHGIAHWNLFSPWGLAGFLLFLIAATA